MKGCTYFGLALLLLSCPLASSEKTASPLSKVFELMESLTAKITAEGEEEAKAFKEYFEWCDDAAANLHNEIKTGSEKQEELEATIGKCTADIETCSAKIEDLSGAIAADKKELDEATAVREKEVATFEAAEKELMDAIDTLERAVGILSKEMSKNPASLAQVDTSKVDSVIKGLNAMIGAAGITASDASKLTSLVQARENSEDEELAAPAAAVYETHSSSIFDVLEDFDIDRPAHVDVAVDPFTMRPCGHAYVDFANARQAQAAESTLRAESGLLVSLVA